jgi:uncharacterized protein
MSRQTGPVKLLVLQGTPFCNIDCSYCYLPDRNDRGRMKAATAQAVAEKLVAEGMLEGELEVLFHAGEPLVFPRAGYEEIIATLERSLAPAVKLAYSVQTNATLVSDEWCEFFLAHGMRVGVSLDGPQAIHDRYRVDRAGRGTFARVMRGIETLRRNGIRPYSLGVLHRESLAVPDEMFAFFQSSGIGEVCFNVEELEGANTSTSLGFADAYAAALAFFDRYFELIESTPGSHWLREYSYAMRRLCAGTVHDAEVNPFEMLTVDHLGNYCTFSPELAGHRSERDGNLTLGNVHTGVPFREAFAAAGWVRDVAAGVELCRQSCRYFEVCGGGSPSNKLAENRSFASTETLTCRLNIQAPTDAMLSRLARRSASLAAS